MIAFPSSSICLFLFFFLSFCRTSSSSSIALRRRPELPFVRLVAAIVWFHIALFEIILMSPAPPPPSQSNYFCFVAHSIHSQRYSDFASTPSPSACSFLGGGFFFEQNKNKTRAEKIIVTTHPYDYTTTMKSGASLRATSAVVSSRSRIPNLLSMTVAVGCTPRHESSPSLIFFRVCVCFPLFFSCSVPKSWMGNKTKSTKLILSDEHATVETCYYCVNYVCRGERECGKWIKDECSASVY